MAIKASSVSGILIIIILFTNIGKFVERDHTAPTRSCLGAPIAKYVMPSLK